MRPVGDEEAPDAAADGGSRAFLEADVRPVLEAPAAAADGGRSRLQINALFEASELLPVGEAPAAEAFGFLSAWRRFWNQTLKPTLSMPYTLWTASRT